MSFSFRVTSHSDNLIWNNSDRCTKALSALNYNSVLACEQQYSTVVLWPAHSLIKTQAQHCIGAITSTSSAEKKWHWWSHQSGLWVHRHLHGPSTSVRHSDCQVSRPHGPHREVRSLLTHISCALGQNNKHCSSLHMPTHSQMKNCAPEDIILHET